MARTVAEPDAVVAYWLEEIRLAKQREERYRKTGQDVLKIYEADDEHEAPFNILFSNTETLRPALYATTPRPLVMRRFKDADPIGKAASDAGRRMLEYLLDTNREGYETTHESMGACVLDALLPGRGMVTVKYDATFQTYAEPRPPDDDAETPVTAPEPVEYAASELVCTESVVWDRVHFGYAKKWHKVPWIAYEYYLTKEEVAAHIDKKMATKLTYQSPQHDGKEDGRTKQDDTEKGARKTACVYQIWDKAGGKVIRYVSPHYLHGVLKEEEDPLGLTGFFNTPRPLQFIEKSATLVPTAPYKMYKNQAKELNRLTRRISRLIEAIKARGIYDGAIGNELSKIMESDDNTLIPAEVASSLSTEKGFQNAIWFMPLDVLMAVLVQLYQARESCKQVIYEITGVSDILRGATQASETATAQTIKNQWGTLRLKRSQAEVARYMRDLLRLMLELAATKMSEETWAQATQLPFLTQQQQFQIQQQMLAIQQTGQPIPPALQQQAQQIPWQAVLDLLKTDLLRSYHIDIETNSTVEPDATDDIKSMTETMAMLGQFLNGAAPLVASGSMPFEVVKSMLLVITRRSRFGHEIEDLLQQMQPPKPPDDGKGAEQAQQQMEMQKQHAVAEVSLKQKQAEMALQEKTMQAEMQLKQQEMDLQMREMQLQVKEAQFQMAQQVETKTLEMDKQRASEEIGVQRKVGELENKKYRTENVVNQKADTALGQGVKAMQSLVEQLVKAVAVQSEQNHEMIETLVQTMSKPRTKKAIRGKDGRLEGVEEVVA